MKQIGVRAATVFAAIAVLAPVSALALDVRAGENPSIGSGERILTNEYLAGGTVVSAGTLQGDLTAAGGTVLVTGPVRKDVLAAGGTLSIQSDVSDDVRAVGGNILVQGKIGNDLTLAGGQITVAGAGIGGDVMIGGGSVTIDAPVAGKVLIAGGEVTINAAVGGDLEVRAKKVTLGPNAAIAGDFTYTAQSVATIKQGASVNGHTTFTQATSSAPSLSFSWTTIVGLAALLSLTRFFMLFAGALIIYLLVSRLPEVFVKEVVGKPWPTLGIGAVTLIVAPVVGVGLLISVIGVPLAAMVFLMYALAIILSVLFAQMITGAVVYHWITKKGYVVSWQTILYGSIVYILLGFIPIVGWLAKCVIVLLALGALARTLWDALSNWR